MAEAGKTYTCKKEPKLFYNGWHGHESIIEALRQAKGTVLCCLRIWGDVKRGDTVLCGRSCKVLWMLDATDVLHRFACREAKHFLDRFDIDDESCRSLLAVKSLWIHGVVTDSELEDAQELAMPAFHGYSGFETRDVMQHKTWRGTPQA